ncbi:MAG: hypothetical protein P8076_13005 [Gammaproteobacteria bacterium]
MTAVRKFVLAILVLAGVAYGGFKGYVYYKYKGAVDEAIAQAAPFVEIRYGSLTSSLDGSIGLSDVTIIPRRYDDHFQIESIQVHFPNVLYLFNGASELKRGQLPQRAGISIHGLKVQLDGQAMRSLERDLRAKAARVAGGAGPCGDARVIGPSALQAMGYDNLVLDMDTGYRFEDGHDGMLVHLGLKSRNMWSMNIDMDLLGPTRSVISMMRARGASKLQAMTMDFKDDSYTGRLLKYCSQQSGRSEADTINAMVNQAAAAYMREWGFVPGPGIRAAYRSFLTHPGELHITAKPSEPVNTASLALYRPQDRVRMLNLTAQVNGKPVSDLSMRTMQHTPAAPSVARQPAAPKPGSPRVTAPPHVVHRAAVPAAPTQPVSTTAYRQVSKRSLGSHVGRPVRVYTNEGQLRAGVLAAYSDGEAVIEQHIYGGTFAARVPVRDISKVEVLSSSPGS